MALFCEDHLDDIKGACALAECAAGAMGGIMQVSVFAPEAIGVFSDQPQDMRWAHGDAATASGASWCVYLRECGLAHSDPCRG